MEPLWPPASLKTLNSGQIFVWVRPLQHLGWSTGFSLDSFQDRALWGNELGHSFLIKLFVSYHLNCFVAPFFQLVQSCCMRTESGRMDPAEDPYRREEEQPSPNPLPVYSPQTPVTQTPVPTPVIVVSTAVVYRLEGQRVEVSWPLTAPKGNANFYCKSALSVSYWYWLCFWSSLWTGGSTQEEQNRLL